MRSYPKKRTERHKDALINFIFALREEIIQEVLLKARAGETACPHSLKHKADLIRKYSRKHRLMSL